MGERAARTARSCSRSRAREGKGIVAGTDGQGSSLDIRASFDGILGAPVAFGRTTHTSALFRAVSAHHKRRLVQAVHRLYSVTVGCSEYDRSHGDSGRSALDLVFKTVPLNAGAQKTLTIQCPSGETLVDTWNATAFNTNGPPPPGFASAIRVKAKQVGAKVQVAMSASEALPSSAKAQVQVGVRCATG